MRKRLGLIAAWMIATGLSVVIASQAVGGVGEQVTDRPAALPGNVATVADGESIPTAAPPVAAAVTTAAPAPANTVAVAGPETTSAPSSLPPVPTTDGPEPTSPPSGGTTTTTSTTTTSTSTTSTSQVPFSYSQHQLTGGAVVLRFRPQEVYLESATPNPGFTVKVEKTGPDSVEVEFRSDGYEGELHAEWRDGELDVDIDEGPEEGH